MSKNKYRISQQAIEDLDKIWLYTFNKWSKEQADRYFDLIIAEIEFIESVLYSSVHLKVQTYYCSGKNNLRPCGPACRSASGTRAWRPRGTWS